jgi:hypothetical protein
MKWRFTYKELTLLLGVLVAVIIMLSLWLRPVSVESGEVSEKPIQQVAKPAAKILLEKASALVLKTIR